jgi:phytoene dehydrogenase-like protein
MDQITVVGGGIAGLTAAIACAEAGAAVTVHEAHHTLGGRGRAAAGPYLAHEGPHVFYCDGPHWAWLAGRGLTGPPAPFSLRDQVSGVRFWHEGRLRRVPPVGWLRMVYGGRKQHAPADRSFRDWAAGIWGERAAAAAASFTGVVTYDADPGRLSAAFVWQLLMRVTAAPAAVRYPAGGWAGVIGRMAARAQALGVRIETGARAGRLPGPPVIVATQLESARQLLGDPGLAWESGRTALLDLGLQRRRGDPAMVNDLDTAAVVERLTAQDPSLAPAGCSLIQAHMPIRPAETRASALARLEDILDAAYPRWRHRVTWRREGTAAGRTGALDLPGTTWRDRPAVDRGNGIFLAGDMVAAPGMRGEISINSALQAASGALRCAQATTRQNQEPLLPAGPGSG